MGFHTAWELASRGARVVITGRDGQRGRQAVRNFLTGGTLHVASRGIFLGAALIAARRTKAPPRWIPRLGMVAAPLAVLPLASLIWFPASFLIPLGRLLSFVRCVAVGIVPALGRQRDTVAGG